MTELKSGKRQFLKNAGWVASALSFNALLLPSTTQAATIQTAVSYEVNGRQFEGQLVFDESVQSKRPILFMQPDWKGID